jgi:hypothetical protein
VGSEAHLFKFHSTGCVVKNTKDKVDLQQTWEVGTATDMSTSKTANLLLSLPKGVIQEVYVYQLVGKIDDVKKKGRKKLNKT